MRRAALVVVVTFAFGAHAEPTAPDAVAHDVDAPLPIAPIRAAVSGSMVIDGVTRTYLVYTPPNAKAPAPAVFVLHGRGGSGDQVRKDSGFDVEADRYGAVVVYPDAINHQWFDARQNTMNKGDAVKEASDVSFLVALMDDLAAKKAIDPARVYVIGHSNGAIMTLTLACAHADRLAGIGVVSGAMPMTTCNLARPTAAIFFQGTDDPLIPFLGGSVGKKGARGFVLSGDDTVKVFAEKAGCADGVRRAPVDAVKDDGTDIVVEDRAKCTAPVARVIVEHGGHGWPGRPPFFLKHSREIDATAAMAAFFFDAKLP